MSSPVARQIVYPESDGKPMAENTRQWTWILTLANGLVALFRSREDVFVGGDLLWYPVEGEPAVVNAPDVFVVFGRPKGHRKSYRQWEEGGVPMTVVFEILSPANTPLEMADKLAFYDEHGVEEYYLYDPETNRLMIYLRGREALRRIFKPHGFTSPRLGIRFDLSGPELAVFGPDGRRFLTPEESAAERERVYALTRKALAGQASPDELLELQRLTAQSP
jgi:Uma2 family endonuclease